MSPVVDLSGKRGLVVVANTQCIAAGCAHAFRQAGVELAITYLNEKALPHVEPGARATEATILAPCDVRRPGQLEAVFEQQSAYHIDRRAAALNQACQYRHGSVAQTRR